LALNGGTVVVVGATVGAVVLAGGDAVVDVAFLPAHPPTKTTSRTATSPVTAAVARYRFMIGPVRLR
jgi:hypothetical protein